MTVDLIYAGAVVLCGYLILGTIGFGSALFIVPLLSWMWPLPEVVALVLLLDIPASVLFGGLNLKQVDFAELVYLLPGMAVGSGIGFWLQGAVPAQWPVLGLGIYIASVGLRALLGPKPPGRSGSAWRPFAGFAAGFIEVMFATAGPVVLAWLNRRLHSVHAVRATTPTTMIVCAGTAVAVIALHGALGEQQLWLRWASLLLVAGAGVTLGNALARRISAGVLARLVSAMLIASGVSLVLRSVV